MEKTLFNAITLLLAFGMLGCRQSSSEEGKSIASTHPELEKQLEKNSVEAPISQNEHPELYDQYRITLQKYENSGDYRVQDMYRGRLAPLDEQSHQDARTYKTALREGLQKGVNFAGQYTVVTVGCGTGCQTHYIVDRQSGRVLDKIQSAAGAAYSANSRLLIINPPDSNLNYNQCLQCAPKAYILKKNKLRPVELPGN